MPVSHGSGDGGQLSELENSHSPPLRSSMPSLQPLTREGCRGPLLTLATPRQAIPVFPVLSLLSGCLLLHLVQSTQILWGLPGSTMKGTRGLEFLEVNRKRW